MSAELYRDNGSEPLVSTTGFALLLGVDEAELRAEMSRQGQAFKIPKQWERQGRRRSKEYQAATGRTDMKGALEYWAARKGAS